MKIHSSISAVLLSIGILCQGCVVFWYPTTPKVSGVVIDENSNTPVIGARVGMRDHEKIHSSTGRDGTFHLPPNREWGPAFIIPFEGMTRGRLFVEAPGYITVERGVESWGGSLLELDEPIVLEKD
ncbi:MAG: hypothetical protein KC944_21230 [Candidatus Omnitrophica bacterium]|nr:hypothetical protein [Candidatus Omnitrophota bacterium]